MRPTTPLFVLALALLACRRGPSSSSGGPSAESTVSGTIGAAMSADALTESYASHNGLITVRYPAAFAAKTVGESSVILAKNLPDGTDEAMAFVSVDKPISDEVAEYARVVDAAAVKELHQYAQTTWKASTCNGQKGMETTGTWVTEQGHVTYVRRACHFLRHGHGFSFSYSIPRAQLGSQDPLLLSIREATQFNK